MKFAQPGDLDSRPTDRPILALIGSDTEPATLIVDSFPFRVKRDSIVVRYSGMSSVYLAKRMPDQAGPRGISVDDC